MKDNNLDEQPIKSAGGYVDPSDIPIKSAGGYNLSEDPNDMPIKSGGGYNFNDPSD
jgi:hypothetical protein